MKQIANKVQDAIKAGVGPSYAEVSKHGASPQEDTVIKVAAARELSVNNTSEVIIEPTPNARASFGSSDDVKAALTRNVKASAYGLKVLRLVRMRECGVRMKIAGGDLEGLKKDVRLRESGLTVRLPSKLNPRMILHGVPASAAASDILQDLGQAGLADGEENDMKFVYRYPDRSRATTSMVIEVGPATRARLLKTERLYIGLAVCRVEDHIRVLQCFKCLEFHHLAKDCKSKNDTCGNCAEQHETRRCKFTGDYRCVNCVNAKYEDTYHSALHRTACPILAQKVEERARAIQFVPHAR